MPKRILQITHKPAYPAIDGGCLEMAKMTQFYQENLEFDLSVFTIGTEKHPFDSTEFKKANLLPEQVTHVATQIKPTFLGGMIALIKGKSYNLSRFRTQEITSKLTELIRSQKFDLIQFESVYSAQLYAIALQYSQAKLILSAPNVEFQLWEQYAQQAMWPKKILFNYLAKKLKEEEIRIWQEMDGIFTITPQVSETIVKHVDCPISTLPFFVKMNNYTLSKPSNSLPSFFHIGAMDWKPNLEGVTWFVNNVWQKINFTNPLHLAGKGMDHSIFSSLMVQEHGFVENALTFMNAHDVMIVPLLSGSGMRIKIIEAMALGKCVVSTSLGAEGIDYQANQNIMIANTAQEFIETLIELNTHPERISFIGSNARKLISDKYSDKQLNKEILPFIHSVLTLEK